MSAGSQSEVGTMERVILKHARDAFVSDDGIGRQWCELGYTGPPDFARAVDEYDRFAELIESFGVDILYLPAGDGVGLDSIYVRDAAVVCDEGLILCGMGKAARRGEPRAAEAAYRAAGVDIRGAIAGEGRLEGGDVAWIDRRTLAVGRGYRSNDEGIRQLRDLLGGCVDELIVVPLPHWRGPGGVFHLMSVLSPIDDDLALVYSPLLPVPFREALLHRGMELIEVPDAEFDTMGCNVLAVAPRRCIALSGNPLTRERLEAAGVEVHAYDGNEISVRGAGGPTCLTRPLARRS
ncbi:MAG: dimethylarginine dimethylaminohydrolase family protein [Candidatus Krumholzibacteriia bacterium]